MQFNKFNYHVLVAVIILLTNSSCQRVIDLKLDSAAAQIVIEGNVTNVHGTQYVMISQSVPFTNTNTFPPVSKATVTITDGRGNTYNMIESTTPGTYINVFTGRPGTTYTLTVITNGKTYTGSSTMPQQVFFDPLSYSTNTFKKNTELITVNYQDPANTPNQYRFVLYVNGVQDKTIFDANDNFNDGSVVGLSLYQNDDDIVTGDTVIVEEQCIDKNMFTYWFSLSQQQNNGQGGGTAPSNPPSNLSNNALGYFSAHTDQKQGIVIK